MSNEQIANIKLELLKLAQKYSFSKEDLLKNAKALYEFIDPNTMDENPKRSLS